MKPGPKKRTDDDDEDYSKLSLKKLERITEKFLKLLRREANE